VDAGRLLCYGGAVRYPALILLVVAAAAASPAAVQPRLIHATLEYRAPGDGKPAPNFSPKGTQVQLTDVSPKAVLPAGAVRPARSGIIAVGPDKTSWIPVLATASKEFPGDLCQIFLDRNRNGSFRDDGPALTGAPSQNARTKAWWTSINKVELKIPYSRTVVEPYLVNMWIVREDGAPAPDILRFSVGSWRQGVIDVDGTEALVAAMDSDNDAMFTKADTWSAMSAAEPNAAKAVLTIAEARPTNRLMFLAADGKEKVIEFRRFSADGRSIDFVVIDKNITKASDRAPDDLVRDERARPRAQVPFEWGHGSAGLTTALARARESGKLVLIDFEATWCGPCHTMDEWIWTDAEVAARLNESFVGVKIDADLEKAIVQRYTIAGYPTMMVVDGTGKELKRVIEYQSSKQMLEFVK